jgi:hypothetical protein
VTGSAPTRTPVVEPPSSEATSCATDDDEASTAAPARGVVEVRLADGRLAVLTGLDRLAVGRVARLVRSERDRELAYPTAVAA